MTTLWFVQIGARRWLILRPVEKSQSSSQNNLSCVWYQMLSMFHTLHWIGHVNIQITFFCNRKFSMMLHNTQSKSDWLFFTQCKLIGWLENNETTLNIVIVVLSHNFQNEGRDSDYLYMDLPDYNDHQG